MFFMYNYVQHIYVSLDRVNEGDVTKSILYIQYRKIYRLGFR
jgi:hypothetical protein